MKRTRTRGALAVLALLALVGVYAIRASAYPVPDFIVGGGPSEGGELGGAGSGWNGITAGYGGGDTIRTPTLRVFGARQVVWTWKAATGACSLAVCQVSADSTKWFWAGLHAGIGGATSSIGTGGALPDSLNKGPFTATLYTAPAAGYTLDAINVRYARLIFRPFAGTTVKTFHVTSIVLYEPGDDVSNYDAVYTNSSP